MEIIIFGMFSRGIIRWVCGEGMRFPLRVAPRSFLSSIQLSCQSVLVSSFSKHECTRKSIYRTPIFLAQYTICLYPLSGADEVSGGVYASWLA